MLVNVDNLDFQRLNEYFFTKNDFPPPSLKFRLKTNMKISIMPILFFFVYQILFYRANQTFFVFVLSFRKLFNVTIVCNKTNINIFFAILFNNNMLLRHTVEPPIYRQTRTNSFKRVLSRLSSIRYGKVWKQKLLDRLTSIRYGKVWKQKVPDRLS